MTFCHFVDNFIRLKFGRITFVRNVNYRFLVCTCFSIYIYIYIYIGTRPILAEGLLEFSVNSIIFFTASKLHRINNILLQ